MSEQIAARWRRSPLASFFGWWRQELLGCLPPSLRRRFSKQADRVSLHWPLQDDAPPVAGQNLTLLLAPELALVCELDLPRMSLRAAREVLLFELDKYTPFSPDRACFDVLPLAQASAQGIRVRLLLIDRARLEAIVSQVQALGATVAGVDVLDDERRVQHLDLLPASPESRSRQRQRWLRQGALALAVILVLACMTAWVERRERALETRREQLGELRASALQVDAMRKQLQVLSEVERTLRLNEAQRPNSVAVLDLLTRCVPEQTWLDSLQIGSDGRLLLSGSSARASELPEQLSECAGVQKAVLLGGIQPDRESGRERFTLQTHWPGVQP